MNGFSIIIPATRFTRGVIFTAQAINGLQFALVLADALGGQPHRWWRIWTGRLFGYYDNGTKGYTMGHDLDGRWQPLRHFGGKLIVLTPR